MVAVVGGPYLLADELGDLRREERAVLEHPALLALLGTGPFRPLDLFERADGPDVPQHAFASSTALPRVWETRRERDRVVALFNWGDDPLRVATPPELVGRRELWTGADAGTEIEIPAHGVRVLRADGLAVSPRPAR
jgi:hypothetical protein